MRWAVAIGSVSLLLACSNGSTVAVRGTVKLMYDVDLMVADPGNFADPSGPCRFGDTARMVITDESGDVIKIVELRDGEHARISCNFEFETSVKEADFYTFRIGNRDGATFSREESEAGVDLTAL